MNKSDLVEAVASRTNGTQQAVLDVIESALAVMQDALADGQEIMLPGFGKFTVVSRAERTGTNPNTGNAMVIPATRYARFTPGTALRAAVRGSSQSNDSGPVGDPLPQEPESITETETEAPAMAKKKDKKNDKKKDKKKGKKKK